ncbi:MAG TPA: hypothetical protein VFT36_00385 [Methylomirabilota bacterium]|nr:hypothetical protein [Methylomirabilota bacterium]
MRAALWTAAVLAAAYLLGCAAAPTRAGIARGLDFCLRYSDNKLPGRACECVEQFERVCLGAGFEARCFADGWNDKDHGDSAWAVAVCQERRRLGLDR